jgi:quinoprotein glucose dehydrogenase
MPGLPDLGDKSIDAIVEYLVTGEDSASGEAESVTQPYRFTGYKRFLDPDGYPAVAPPWGTLNAIDLTTGEYAWQIPFGEYPELAANGMKNTGSENYGGPIVTAGGLLFIGATSYDRKLHAFDKLTGELLWEWTLPFAGNATPSTFEAEGRQFVVIAAGGGRAGKAPTGGIYVAFALMERSVVGSRMVRPIIATGIEPWERKRSWKPRSPSRLSCSRRISRMRCDPTK